MARQPKITHEREARRLGLIIVPSEDLTVEREAVKDGHTYLESGRPISAARRKKLSQFPVPPAWEDVRMAADANAHIQVIGTDAKGRRQYIYHDDWPLVREAVKAQRLRLFGTALPLIRDRVRADMKRPLNDMRGITATAIRLIDRQWVRAGHEQYAADGTAGTATLLGRHLRDEDGQVKLEFPAKSGKRAKLTLRDPALKRRLRLLKKRGGRRLFQPKAGARPVNATKLNQYLAEIAEAPVSVKDFRTFGGSSMALANLCDTADEPKRKHAVAVVKRVAKALRNTPSVARSSYIHGPLLSAYLEGELAPSLAGGRLRAELDAGETALMRFLER